MGLLDKLMFWKDETPELDYDVEGCFTLPSNTLPANPDVQESAPIEAANQVSGSVAKPDC